MTVGTVLYALIGAALLGSAMGVFVRKFLVAVLAAVPLVVVPMGAILTLKPYLENNALLGERARDVILELADPTVVLQMAVACVGGALLAGLLSRLASAGETEPRAAPRTVRKRVAAVTDGRSLQRRADRIATQPRAPAAPPIYEVAPVLGGPITASSVADIVRDYADPSSQASERRGRGRRRAILAGLLLLDDGRSCHCRIVDMSDTGARVRLPTLMPLPDKLWLLNTSGWAGYEVELKWRSDMDIGLRFLSKRDLRDPITERDKALHALCADLAAR